MRGVAVLALVSLGNAIPSSADSKQTYHRSMRSPSWCSRTLLSQQSELAVEYSSDPAQTKVLEMTLVAMRHAAFAFLVHASFATADASSRFYLTGGWSHVEIGGVLNDLAFAYVIYQAAAQLKQLVRLNKEAALKRSEVLSLLWKRMRVHVIHSSLSCMPRTHFT